MWKKGRAQADLEGSISPLLWCWEEKKEVGPKVITGFPVEPCGVTDSPESRSWWAYGRGGRQTSAEALLTRAVKVALVCSDTA